VPPFEPSFRNGQSGAALITDLASSKPYGYMLTYDEISEQLGISADDLVRLRSAMARAKPRVLKEHLRAMVAVPGKGYRIIPAKDQPDLALRYRKKSDRSIKRAIATVTHVDEGELTPAQQERNRQVGMALNLLYERQRDTEARVSRLEKLMLGERPPKVVQGEVVEPRAIEGPE
jgi:hypothetical protein